MDDNTQKLVGYIKKFELEFSEFAKKFLEEVDAGDKDGFYCAMGMIIGLQIEVLAAEAALKHAQLGWFEQNKNAIDTIVTGILKIRTDKEKMFNHMGDQKWTQ